MAKTFFQDILHKRGILFNLLFFVYLLFFQPLLLRRVSWVIERGQTDFWLGMLMITVSILETFGIFWKTPAVAQRLKQAKRLGEADDAGFGFIFLVWIFHTVIAVSLMMMAFNAFGIWRTGQTDEINGWAMGIMVAVIIKEIVILVFWIDQFTTSAEENKLTKTNLFNREIWGDIALFLFGAVAFTSIWEFIASNTPIDGGHIIYILIQYALAVLLCLMFFLPIRSLFIFEEFLNRTNTRDDLFFWGSILINVLFSLTLIPLPS